MSAQLTNIKHNIQAFLLEKLAKWVASRSLSGKQKLARLLAFVAFNVIKLRRHQVIESMRTHLHLSLSEAEQLGEKTYYQFLINAFEMAGLKYFTREDLLNRISVEGLRHLDAALAHKKGAIIVSAHFGLWELVPSWLVINGYDMAVVVRRQTNPIVDQWFNEMRQRHGAVMTDSGFGIREILKALRKNHLLGLMVDQDNGKQGIFVPFFERWASAPTGPAQIAMKTGAPIVPLAIFPNFKGRHHIRIYEAFMPDDYTQDVVGQQQLTANYTQILEAVIRSQPQHWFWLHRRWKTQPADAPDNPSAKLLDSALTSSPKKG